MCSLCWIVVVVVNIGPCTCMYQVLLLSWRAQATLHQLSCDLGRGYVPWKACGGSAHAYVGLFICLHGICIPYVHVSWAWVQIPHPHNSFCSSIDKRSFWMLSCMPPTPHTPHKEGGTNPYVGPYTPTSSIKMHTEL